MRIRKNGAARGVSRVVLSLAFHGAGLALVLWMGVLMRSGGRGACRGDSAANEADRS